MKTIIRLAALAVVAATLAGCAVTIRGGYDPYYHGGYRHCGYHHCR